jgi:glycosyltransferase involved in cell wall biosynthesis
MPMKIHLYARDFPIKGEGFEGGLVKAVHGLAGGFAHNGADVNIVCHARQQGSRRALAGYRIHYFERTLTAPLGLSLSGGLRQYMDDCDRSDVFVLNGVFNPDTYALSRACRQNKIGYVSWPHDPYNRQVFAKRGYLKWPHWYLRDRPMLRGARAIQVFDSRHTEWLRKLAVTTPTIEIPNGIDPQDVIPESDLRWNSNGPAKLIYLGRIDYFNKGLDVLLDSFASIRIVCDARLTIQGPDDGDSQMLRLRAAKMRLGEDRIEFREPQFDRKATEILAEHDIFVLPSRFEGFGLSALEAMVSARVLLVPWSSGLAKHVRAAGCGVVVTPDAESVTKGIYELMEHRPRWKEMGMAGREYALANFRWDRIAAELMVHYAHGLPPCDTVVDDAVVGAGDTSVT